MYANNQPSDPSNPGPTHNSTNISEHERSWRSKFPKILVLILSIVQLIFIVLIFILEIASLGIDTTSTAGAGIWCAIGFLPACILSFILVRMRDGSRKWATIVFIAQIVLLIFTFILIGITGNYVQTANTDIILQFYQNKYRVVQAELAFGILLMFSGFVYIGIYIYVLIVALWQPFHTLDTNHFFRD